MADIVKAVGNCSYNQLVEKIISCKQSDNSELAGEGGYLLFSSVFFSFCFHTFIQTASYRRRVLLIRNIIVVFRVHSLPEFCTFRCINALYILIHVLKCFPHCIMQINNYQSHFSTLLLFLAV